MYWTTEIYLFNTKSLVGDASFKTAPAIACIDQLWVVIDRYLFFITDTNYLYVYVPDNRYAEPIFIYCYKVHK